MTVSTVRPRAAAETRQRLIEATQRLVLRQGFNATTVDQICAEAGLTKGSFFHHFENKEAIGLAAIEAWGEAGTRLYARAWTGGETDPLAQLHAMIDIMISFTEKPDEPCVCVVGMMAQELSQTRPALRAGCARELDAWAGHVAGLLTRAKTLHPPVRDFDPQEVAWFLQSVWQGSMLLGKTCRNPGLIRVNLRLARGVIDQLFTAPGGARPS